MNNTTILNNNSQPESNIVNQSMAAGYNMNSNFGINSVNQQQNVNNSYYGLQQVNNSCRFEDAREEGQKRTLEEFKRLLSKIDEKLDLPVKQS